MVLDRIEREIFIAAPPERVWAVLTEAEHLAGRIDSETVAEVDLRSGGSIVLRMKAYGTILMRLTLVDPPHALSFRWARPTDAEPRSGNSTLVEFTLTPEGTGTRLRVVESGIRDLALTDEEKITYADGNREGWIGQLDQIRDYAGRLAA